MGRIATLLIVLLLWQIPPISAAEGDLAGSSDYPAVGRFEGTVITGYAVSDFDEYLLPTGPAKGKEFESAEALEGKVYRISYKRGPGPSILEVARNFEQRLTDEGFDILYTCKAKDCGERDFRYAIETLPEPRMVIDSWKYRYIAAKKSGEGPEVHVSVLVSTNNNNIYVQVFAVESEAMAFRMVDAEAMSSAISETGRIALYGIHFDTDKSDIKAESRPTLDEIGRLLTDNPDLDLIVVGHTDNQGSMDYNMKLSKQRAKAVVKDLVKTYKIDKKRLTGAGVGFLAPIARNDSEEGRAQNRRVELIEP